MADIRYLAPFLLSWEGGFVDDPKDRGGATNMGVTLRTWRSVGYDKDGDNDIDVFDLKLITRPDAIYKVMKPHYWDKMRCDEIEDQGVANIIADWAYMSGPAKVARKIQQILGLKADGIVGPKTIAAINAQYPQGFFQAIKHRRESFYSDIVANNPSQKRFLRGWMNRLNSIKYDRLECNGGEILVW